MLGIGLHDKWWVQSASCDSTCSEGPQADADVGDSIAGSITQNSCSNGSCSWATSITDADRGTQGVLSTQDTSYFPDAVAGAVEVYGLTDCDQFPDTAVFYTGIALYDGNGQQVTPNWQSITNQSGCDFRVATTSTSVSLLYHNALTVSISGPSSVRPNVTCTWDVSATGGTAPYTYNWYKGAVWEGSGSELSMATGSSNFALRATAGNADFRTRADTLNVTVTSGAPICPTTPQRK